MEGWSGSFDEFLSQLAAHLQGGTRTPKTNNPEDYPRAVKVSDSEALMMRTEMKMREDRLEAMSHQANLLISEIGVAKERLFMRLREVYPRIEVDEYGDRQSVGYRHWKGDLYFTGWNARDTGQEKGGKDSNSESVS